MNENIVQEIVEALIDGDCVICESADERNQVIKACISAGFHPTSLTADIFSNRNQALKRYFGINVDAEDFTALEIYEGAIYIYSKFHEGGYSTLSFKHSQTSPDSAFDDDFLQLIGG